MYIFVHRKTKLFIDTTLNMPTMQFRTIVDIHNPKFAIPPCEKMLFVGSCFAERIGRRFQEEQFRTTVNPYGVMYNPVSILHTVSKVVGSGPEPFRMAFLTLGTNHVYILKETGEVVDNCQKRPQRLFEEKALDVSQCVEVLRSAVELLRSQCSDVRVVVTVSPIRYAKYGYHGSALSKAVLLLSAEKLTEMFPETVTYFPAYEIVNDELRDYRFYQPDMLHPSDQTVEYIWQRFSDAYLSQEAKTFIEEWRPVKEALAHRPFQPDSEAYQNFRRQTMEKARELARKYPNMPPLEASFPLQGE